MFGRLSQTNEFNFFKRKELIIELLIAIKFNSFDTLWSSRKESQ